MSPLNRGPLMAPRMPSNMRPLPMGRYGRAPPPPPPLPGMAGRPGMPPPPMAFRPRGRPLPPPLPPRSVMMPGMYGPPPSMPMIPGGPLPPPMMRHMGPRGPMPIRPGPRGMMPPHALPHMRPRYPPNSNGKGKQGNKKSNKLEVRVFSRFYNHALKLAALILTSILKILHCCFCFFFRT